MIDLNVCVDCGEDMTKRFNTCPICGGDTKPLNYEPGAYKYHSSLKDARNWFMGGRLRNPDKKVVDYCVPRQEGPNYGGRKSFD